MSQTCQRCYKIVHRACQSDTEAADCPSLKRDDPSPAQLLAAGASRTQAIEAALNVLVLTPHIRRYLIANDPKALEQALRALAIR